MSKIAPIDLAYAAGIIDGEGCIDVTFGGKDGKKAYAQVRVNQTDLVEIVYWLRETFGGNIQRIKGYGRSRPHFRWRLRGDTCVDFLISIRPYLRGKQDQADLVIAGHRTRGRDLRAELTDMRRRVSV